MKYLLLESTHQQTLQQQKSPISCFVNIRNFQMICLQQITWRKTNFTLIYKFSCAIRKYNLADYLFILEVIIELFNSMDIGRLNECYVLIVRIWAIIKYCQRYNKWLLSISNIFFYHLLGTLMYYLGIYSFIVFTRKNVLGKFT